LYLCTLVFPSFLIPICVLIIQCVFILQCAPVERGQTGDGFGQIST
jgi:hypothetical protein